MRQIITIASAALAALAVAGGCLLLLSYGLTAPLWLRTGSAVLCGAMALLCGFTPVIALAAPWLRLRAVRGACLVVLGVGAMYVPPQLIASAVLLAFGIKLVWAEACALEGHDAHRSATRPARDLVRRAMEIQPADRHD